MSKIIFLLIFPIFLFSQTRIDENVSINFPGKTEIINNTTNEAKLEAYYLNSQNDSHLAMRIEPFKNELPENLKGLQNYYKILISEQLKSMVKKGLFLKDSTQIKLSKYLAYKLTYKEINSENESGESLILILNGVTYTFIYSKVESYDIAAKEKFFNSIKINTSEDIKQFDEPYNYFQAFVKILASIFLIFFARWYIKRERKSNSTT